MEVSSAQNQKKLILSRDSYSIGSSSRVYYYSEPVGIPFQWEDSPGKPKNPEQPFDFFIPPLSPPPAMQRPCRAPVGGQVKASSSSPLKSWISKVVFGVRRDQQTYGRGGNKVDFRYHPPPPKPQTSTFKNGSYWSFQIDDCNSGSLASEPSDGGIKKWNISRIMVCSTRGF